jgi:hypothetical protein
MPILDSLPFADFDLTVACRVLALISTSDGATFRTGLVTRTFDLMRMASFASKLTSRLHVSKRLHPGERRSTYATIFLRFTASPGESAVLLCLLRFIDHAGHRPRKGMPLAQ